MFGNHTTVTQLNEEIKKIWLAWQTEPGEAQHSPAEPGGARPQALAELNLESLVLSMTKIVNVCEEARYTFFKFNRSS